MSKDITCAACGDSFSESNFLPGKKVCTNCENSKEVKRRQKDENFRYIDEYQVNPNCGSCRSCDD